MRAPTTLRKSNRALYCRTRRGAHRAPAFCAKATFFSMVILCYNVATKYVPLLRCTTLGCFHPFFHAVWNSAYNFCTTLREKRAAPLSRCNPRFSIDLYHPRVPKPDFYQIPAEVTAGCACLLAEVPLEQPLERLAVAGFVARHLMNGVVDRVEVMCICSACGCPYTLTFYCQLRDIIRDIILIRHARHPPNDIIAT